VVSISQVDIHPNVKGGGFLPTTAEYLDPYSKRTEAAALLAGLCWIQSLLNMYPNHTDSAPPPLPIPVDNEGVVKGVHRTTNHQTSTFDLISPNFDILQAIRMTLKALTIRTEISLVKRTPRSTSAMGRTRHPRSGQRVS
jgi:hypothetical protein